MPPNNAKHMVRKKVFGSLDSLEQVDVKERGALVGSWDIAICRDYRGIAGYKQNGATTR